MAEVTLSTKNQIVVPREAREVLGLRSGDKLLAVVRGRTVILMKKPKSYSKELHGLGEKLYGDGYLERERNSW
jgi:AbrB family looped-hinge helix DNA binding protein